MDFIRKLLLVLPFVLCVSGGEAGVLDEENLYIRRSQLLRNAAALSPDEQLVKIPFDSGRKTKKYSKRSVSFNDPGWMNQVYLGSGITAGHNVENVWNKGFSGRDVVIAIIDDGVKYTHEEFKGRYLANLSYDYIDNDSDPTPSNGHGTNCAAVIAGAADNGACGVGVAYSAKIAAIRLVESVLPSDANAAKAFYPFPGHKIDIFSNSWGPPDSGFIVAGPGPQSMMALQEGVQEGRKRLGSLYVFSAGNGAIFGDNCGYNGFVNSIYTIPVAAVNQDGKPAAGSERCSAVMTSAYSVNLETASYKSNTSCDATFGQTSAAAALVSGILGLMLQARNTLTWRDVQHLVVRSSRSDVIERNSVQWTNNMAGFRVSSRVGFGFLDASLLLENVQKWNISLPPQKKCEISLGSRPLTDNSEITSFEIKIGKEQCSNGVIEHLEHVVAKFDLEYFKRGVIGAYITSPGGTTSQILYPRQLDALASFSKYENLTSDCVHFWGETSRGTWKISLRNDLPNRGTGNGTLFGFSLILYGTVTHPMNGTNQNNKNNNTNNTGSSTKYEKSMTTTPKSQEDSLRSGSSFSTEAWIGIGFASALLLIATFVAFKFFILPRFFHDEARDQRSTEMQPQVKA